MQKKASDATDSLIAQPEAAVSAYQATSVKAAGGGSMHEHCLKHKHRYVRVQTHDGCVYQAIVESVDNNHVNLAVPMCFPADQIQGSANMAYGYPIPSIPMQRAYPAYGYPSYAGTSYARLPFIDPAYPGYYPGHYYPYGYGRRFGRVSLPLAALAALSVLPFY